MKRLIPLVMVLGLLASCSVAKIKNGQSYSGTSMDVLQEDQQISASLVEDKLKVRILAGKFKCDGEFQYKDSQKSYLGLTKASNNYVGMFKKTTSKKCAKALGNKGGKEIEVQVARMGGVLGSSIMSKIAILICDDAEGVCVPQNTFSVTKN